MKRLKAMRVLLLPGIWMPAWTMSVMARRLRDEGFEVQVRGYAGVLRQPHAVQQHLRQALLQVDAVVGHSLGGLMALEALRKAPTCPVQRVVCLGTPLCGSAVARRLRQNKLGFTLGASASLLANGLTAAPSDAVQVGMIAGNRARGIGRIVGAPRGEGDGTVGLDETRSAWLRDHRVVAASHSGLPFSAIAARQTAHFLRSGRFSRDD